MNRMDSWAEKLVEHWGHEEFENYDWAPSRQMGFGCRCGELHDEWWTSLSEIRRWGWQVAAMEARRRRGAQARQPPDWEENYAERVALNQIHTRGIPKRARIKARALLHYNLTKEQRWDLRASKSFTIVAKDGRTYRIREHQTVQLLDEQGQATHALCVVPKENHGLGIPAHDIMLAQKLMLESDPTAFWALANVTDLRPQPAPLAQAG